MSNLAEAVKNSPAQQDSIMSNLGMGVIGPMGPMEPIGLMGRKPVMENHPAQRGYKNSNLVFPMCLAGPAMRDDSVVKAVQRDSGISNLKNSPYRPYRPLDSTLPLNDTLKII